ncbi:hypothetical protein ASE49_14025 [Novosphingobium sp. Leaf2]|nr:hypothetical protein ASE49_14025 [Novosphingobium sp. Leaf2]
MNYTFGQNTPGKPQQKTLSFGTYPVMTLVAARAKRDEAKGMLAEGRDPAVEKVVAAKAKTVEVENTFRVVADRWVELNSGWSLES